MFLFCAREMSDDPTTYFGAISATIKHASQAGGGVNLIYCFKEVVG